MSSINRLSGLIFGSVNEDVSTLALMERCEGYFAKDEEIIYVLGGTFKGATDVAGYSHKLVPGVDGKNHLIASDYEEARKELVGYRFVTREQIDKKQAKDAVDLINKAIVGQIYGRMPVIELVKDNRSNVLARPKPPGKDFRGKSFADQILAKNPTWDSNIPGVFFVETDKALKAALSAELMSEAEEKPLNDNYNRLKAAISAAHNRNSNSPFLFLATDNGFCLIHKALEKLFTAFAESHVNATQYLKVIVNPVLAPKSLTVMIVDDFVYGSSAAGRLKAGTDGMSFVRQGILTSSQIKSGTGVQFRAISKEIVTALTAADFTEYCAEFKKVFTGLQNPLEIFMKSLNLPEVTVDYKPLEIHKFQKPEHSKKSDMSLTAGAKALASELGLLDKFKEKYSSGKQFQKAIVEWYNCITSKWQKVDFTDGKGKSPGLFAKGATLPTLDLDQTISSILGYNVNAKGIDMVIPVANFKALGKTFLSGAKKIMKADGSYALVVDMEFAAISIKNGGSMRVTPHVIEAAGTASSSDLTEHSLMCYCEAYDKILPKLEEAAGMEEGKIFAMVNDMASGKKPVFKYEGKNRLEPWAVSLLADKQAIKDWLAEEFSVFGMPSSEFAFADSALMEEALATLSKQMTDRMIGGPKRQGVKFGLMMMLDHLKYGEISVPPKFAKKIEKDATICKQPIQSAANTQRVKVISHEEIAEELVALGLVKKKIKKGKVTYIGLNLNVFFVSKTQSEDELYSDDDGDELAVIYVSKEKATLSQIANLLTLPVKMKGIAINAAELSPLGTNSPAKKKAWTLSEGSGDMGFDYVGGSYIGLFVNFQSLLKSLRGKITVPALLRQYLKNWKDHLSQALQFFAEDEGQNELDDAKKTKIQVLFMVIACCMQKHYHVDMVRSGWNGKSELTEKEFKDSGLEMKFIRKVENVIPEAALTKLLSDWQESIFAGEEWNDFVVDFDSVKHLGLELNDFGKEFLGSKRTVTVRNPVKHPITEASWESDDHFHMNMLWCPRVVWEQVHGDTPTYIKEFGNMFLPPAVGLGLAKTTQHNWISYYRTGWRFVTKESLEGKTVVTKRDSNGKPIAWGYLASPLLPAYDENGGFIPYFNPVRAKALNIPGFVNSGTTSIVQPGWFYVGDNNINAVKHEMWLMALWQKWEQISGVPMFKNIIAQDKEGKNYVKHMTPGNIMRKFTSIESKKGQDALPWRLAAGSASGLIKVGKRSLATTNSAVHSAKFGLAGEMTEDHKFDLMVKWFKSFGLDPATTKDEDDTVYTVKKVRFMLKQIQDGEVERFFPEVNDGFWADNFTEDEDRKKIIGGLKASLVLNAMAHAGFTIDEWSLLFSRLGNEKVLERSKKKDKPLIAQVKETNFDYAIRASRYDMINLVALQAPECEFTSALKAGPWSSLSTDMTQTVIIKAKAVHSHEMGVDFDDCPGCKTVLKQELKRIGRSEKTEWAKKYTASVATWLSYLGVGFDRPLTQWLQTKKVSEKERNSIKSGELMTLEDFKPYSWFFSGLATRSENFKLFGGKSWEALDAEGSEYTPKDSLKSVLVGASLRQEFMDWFGKSNAIKINRYGITGVFVTALGERKVEIVEDTAKAEDRKRFFSVKAIEPINFVSRQTAPEGGPEPKGKITTKISDNVVLNPPRSEKKADPAAPSQEQPGATLSYAGIGSREAATSKEVMDKLTAIGKFLAEQGYTLRSGGAPGADVAFETGCDLAGGNKEIYLPWKGFNGNASDRFGHCEEAAKIAHKHHPQSTSLSKKNMKFIGRNSYQVLGQDLKSQVSFIVCWTPGAQEVGGTGQAIRIAKDLGIRIYNVADETQLQALRDLFSANNNVRTTVDENLYYGDGFVDHAPEFDLPFDDNGGEYEVIEDQVVPDNLTGKIASTAPTEVEALKAEVAELKAQLAALLKSREYFV